MQVLEYLDAGGRSSFARLYEGLNGQAAAKITIALTRMRNGNLANTRVWAAASWSIESISDPVIGFISGWMVT